VEGQIYWAKGAKEWGINFLVGGLFHVGPQMFLGGVDLWGKGEKI